MSTDTGYHAPINVDALEHRDGRWGCSTPTRLELPRRRTSFLPIVLTVVLLLLVALVVWLVRFSLQR